MHEFEIFINIWLQGMGAWLSTPMQIISLLGTQYFQIVLIAWLFWCIDQKVAIRLPIVFIAGNSLNVAFKWLFHAPRPYWINTNVKPFSSESSFGIPSGHAMMSTIFFGRIAIWLNKKWFTFFILVLIFLICLSRIYLGVHFLSDVIAGLAFGISILIILHRLEQPVATWLNRKSLRSRIAIYFLSSIAIILFFNVLKSILAQWQIPEDWLINVQEAGQASSINPIRIKDIYTLSGLGFGMMAGYAWLRNKINFLNPGNPIQNIFRLAIGLTGLAIIMLLFEQITHFVPSDMINFLAIYFQYFLVGLWITGAAPILYKKIGLSTEKDL